MQRPGLESARLITEMVRRVDVDSVGKQEGVDWQKLEPETDICMQMNHRGDICLPYFFHLLLNHVSRKPLEKLRNQGSTEVKILFFC